MKQWIQNFLVCKLITTQIGGTKVNGACYAIRSMVHICNINTLKSIILELTNLMHKTFVLQ